jgi:hypothetical protein
VGASPGPPASTATELPAMTSPAQPPFYIVEVDDRCHAQLVGHSGCAYASPPQPAAQALALVRALLACPQHGLQLDHGPWRCAIAGGTRTIRLRPVPTDGQRTPCRSA